MNIPHVKGIPVHPSTHRLIYAFVLLVMVLLLAHPLANACPACKDALFDPGQLHQRLSAARGYAVSIILLLSVPLILVSSVVALIVRTQRAQRLHRISVGTPSDPDGKIDTSTLSD